MRCYECWCSEKFPCFPLGSISNSWGLVSESWSFGHLNWLVLKLRNFSVARVKPHHSQTIASAFTSAQQFGSEMCLKLRGFLTPRCPWDLSDAENFKRCIIRCCLRWIGWHQSVCGQSFTRVIGKNVVPTYIVNCRQVQPTQLTKPKTAAFETNRGFQNFIQTEF